jgi:glycosyltransferase involved in cell wall biosynthesis
MRVLQIVHGLEAGGVKTLSELIGGGLTSRGFAVETATMFPATDASLVRKAAGTLRVAWRMLTGRYDAIIAYQASASILTGVVGRLTRAHRIVHQTALPTAVKAPMRWLDRIAGTLGLYGANVVNSQATAAAFAAYPARYRRALVTIDHGVAAPRATRTRAETLARFKVPDGWRIFLNIGRLTAQKNHDVLIKSLAQVGDARLVVAGDGPRRDEHEALAAQLGVAERVHLLGDVTPADIGDLLGATDLFVFPSLWETFGLAAVEAAIAGLPIIAADLAVLREVLAGTGTVFVAPHDQAGWTQAMRTPAPGGTARRDAALTVARRYAVARMVDAYVALLGRREGAGAPALTPRADIQPT